MPVFVVVGAVAVPIAAGVALLYAIWLQKRVLAVDAAWRVELCDLTFDEPLVILGRGAFGTVLRAREMRALSKVRHTNVATVLGAVMRESVRGQAPILVMEYMEHGSLRDILQNQTLLIEEDMAYSMLKDVVQGMRYLHSGAPPLIHGDLKASNVLIDSSFRAKVSYFGNSMKKRIGLTLGTPAYMAPELLSAGKSSTASDVYAFGILLFEVCSRKDPYEEEDLEKTLVEVVSRGKRPTVDPGWPKVLLGLMDVCWNQYPAARPSFEGVDFALATGNTDAAKDGSDTSFHSSLVQSRARMRRASKALADVYPPHIAEALASGRPIEPMYRDTATVYFSDIVGFTTISAKLDPRKVADMLNRLYEKFDQASDELGVFKVETIGDAYLATTNLLQEQEGDHVARMARFALRCVEAANQTLVDEDDPSGGFVVIRAGFHSGPVVANVVGTKYRKFSVLGDTVNTASRMESNSVPGRVQCSEAAARLLSVQAPQMRLEDRGEIEIKGKGSMRTFFVNGEQDIQGKSESFFVGGWISGTGPGTFLFRARQAAQ